MKKIEFETFREIGSYEKVNLTQENTSCFNGNVRIKKYKVTIEEIEEPIGILQKRLQDLWDTSESNHYQWKPMEHVAKSLNYKLKGSMGNKYKK